MCRTCGKRHNSYEFNASSGVQLDGSLDSAGSVPLSSYARSPAKFLPMRGRNMKECEEQINHLKNENFSLKLRVYFLEETLTNHSANDQKEDLVKVNMELKVQKEALKKDLHDKQELVRQASALLSNLEEQYKAQVEDIREQAEREKQTLIRKIDQLEKELSDHWDKCDKASTGELSRLCGLAFSDAGDDADVNTLPDPSTTIYQLQSSPMQGIFSLQGPQVTKAGTDGDGQSNRVGELDALVANLEKQVEALHKTLKQKEEASNALEQKLLLLSKEVEEGHEKVADLEAEINDKDEKVDQLMQELETRHLEIQAKESTIQTLHEDLIRVEPEIEIKVQQIVEKDRLIEEKLEQLEQQNKILVEIQITLDEKQKLISELEESLRRASAELETQRQDFLQAQQKIKDVNAKLGNCEKEIQAMRREGSKKEKKINDLTAQLKETLDMLQKASWEAGTKHHFNDVREMADDEHEGLWAELEEKKKQLETLSHLCDQKDTELRRKDYELQQEKIKAEKAHENFQKLKIASAGFTKTLMERDKTGKMEEHITNADCTNENYFLHSDTQEEVISSLKENLHRVTQELQEKKQELAELKQEVDKNNKQIKKLLAQQLSGQNGELRFLHRALWSQKGQPKEKDEILKIVQALSQSKHNDRKLCSPLTSRRSSLSDIEGPRCDGSQDHKESTKPSRSTRSNSCSTLENALFAHMGQKVYNTNQTFNTYVMPEGNEAGDQSKGDTRVVPEVEISACDQLPDQSELSDDVITRLYKDMQSLRSETQALRQQRESINEKINCLHSLSSKCASRENSIDKEGNSQSASSIHSSMDSEHFQQKDVKDNSGVLQSMLQVVYKKICEQKKEAANRLWTVVTDKHHKTLMSYKEEIASLRQRLANSHNAYNSMRTQLDELVDVLEQMNAKKDGNDAYSVTWNESAAKAVKRSRELLCSVSHSLMIRSHGSTEQPSNLFMVNIKDITNESATVPLPTTNTAESFHDTRTSDSTQIINAVPLFTYDEILQAFSFDENYSPELVNSFCGASSDIGDKKGDNVESNERSNNISLATTDSQSLQHSANLCTEVPRMSKNDERFFEQGIMVSLGSSAATSIVPDNEIDKRTIIVADRACSIKENESLVVLASPSESEAWSEPDRQVSLARIGLDGVNENCGSQSRTDRCNTVTSESDIDDDSIVVGPNNAASLKQKKRLDALEIKRLASKIKGLEEINVTLKAELNIYKNLSNHFHGHNLGQHSSLTYETANNNHSVFTMNDATSAILTEIQSLQLKLQETIANNDSLRDQLEAALTDSKKNIGGGILQSYYENTNQHLVDCNNEKMKLRRRNQQIQEQIVQLEKNCSVCHARNRELHITNGQLLQDLQLAQAALDGKQNEVCSLISVQKLEEETILLKNASLKEKQEQIRNLTQELDDQKNNNNKKQQKILELQLKIQSLEGTQFALETQIAEQNQHINDLCEKLTKYKDQMTSCIAQETFSKIQNALEKSEEKVSLITAEKNKSQHQLTMAKDELHRLHQEMEELKHYTKSSQDCLVERLKTFVKAQQHNEHLMSQNKSLKHQLSVMAEHIAQLRSNLDSFQSEDALTTSKCVREIAMLLKTHDNLQKSLSGFPLGKQFLGSQCSGTSRNHSSTEISRGLYGETCLMSPVDASKSEKSIPDLSSLGSPISTTSPECIHDTRSCATRGEHFCFLTSLNGRQSPDLGISSDGHTSSLDRSKRTDANTNPCYHALCYDPSHQNPWENKKSFPQERETMCCTKDYLEHALQDFLHLQQRRERNQQSLHRHLKKTDDFMKCFSDNIS